MSALLAWYDAHARTLPWRSPPESPPPPPYRVWLSEVMLQQTGTTVVAPYFTRFDTRWPTVEALAAADDADVMREWAGLGYYARARNLRACARAVVARGGWPDTEAGLRALPGVGAYTAAAIAAIAFDRRAVVVDGNVERVIARLHAVDTPLPAAKRTLYTLADRLTPAARAGDHAQAMMDLGATVCTPRSPRCTACPLAAECIGRATGAPERFPVKAAKAVRPVRVGTAWWIEVDGHVLLERRPASGLLGGMLGLPGTVWLPASEPQCHPRESGHPSPDTCRTVAGASPHGRRSELGPRFRGDDSMQVNAASPLALTFASVPPIRHVFTHFELRLAVAVATPARRPDLPGEWHAVATLATAGLPTLFARAADAVLRARADAAQSPALDLEAAA